MVTVTMELHHLPIIIVLFISQLILVCLALRKTKNKLELTKNPVKFITEFFTNYLLFYISNTNIIVHLINL
ncbi:hypothetical protein COJ37_02865 [Bacillus cereus]|uniref:Uncharacterized protein n=3 Tax=Bacillus cereus group TaxID=86661 RepID=A0A9X7DA10_BACCE|nr:hypothetical protein CJ306_05490 [Bacillus cereus]OTY27306.1 hypothetical protein BK738_13010 [Bacillus thuringiensis serovar rongseni]OTY58348.1 hypothetical protein BK746_12960 [Bacillus thuringiensis serovar yosoo]OTZ29391.1 hypothetical protein BK761_24515 [Bacillus thuringiensis serovar darmstadiensis]OXL91980.1 hypothetical protein B9T53_27150 [Bacillus sp. KbaL1]PGA24435.1 hypothetical protein COL80_18410 [Bacillus thuringiensis]TFW53388.1 hypothetical protein ES895_11145 [Bacillus 